MISLRDCLRKLGMVRSILNSSYAYAIPPEGLGPVELQQFRMMGLLPEFGMPPGTKVWAGARVQIGVFKPWEPRKELGTLVRLTSRVPSLQYNFTVNDIGYQVDVLADGREIGSECRDFGGSYESTDKILDDLNDKIGRAIEAWRKEL